MASKSEFAPPPLEGYFTATEVADLLGVTRQYVNKLIRAGEFSSCRVVGGVYVIEIAEAERVAKERSAA